MGVTTTLLEQFDDKSDFNRLYSGPQDHFDEEFGRYKQEMWKSYKHAQGKYNPLNVNKLGKSEQFFVKKALKTQPQQTARYVDLDYFSKNNALLQRVTDQEHSES